MHTRIPEARHPATSIAANSFSFSFSASTTQPSTGSRPSFEQAEPLTVRMYLAEKGISGRRAQSLLRRFGKAVRTAYVEQYGDEPSRMEEVLGRGMALVPRYHERDRPMFDRVYEEMVGSVG